jgi:DNA-binding NarL/FixJ family response regulator
MRTTLGPALSRQGYQVDYAETKQNALAQLAAHGTGYDVVLCDLYLPDGTGIEVLAEHRRQQIAKPFILMTAYDNPKLDVILGSDSDPPILFKPFHIQDLMTIIESETDADSGAVPQHPAPFAQLGPNLPAPPGAMRVLIVDDSPLIRSRVTQQLKEIAGVEIVGEAGTAADAINALRQFKPDAMTLDLRLPDGNGLNVLRMVKREGLPTAVIVLTSYPYPQYDHRVRAAGAYAFLNKAADFCKVTDRLQALMAAQNQAN